MQRVLSAILFALCVTIVLAVIAPQRLCAQNGASAIMRAQRNGNSATNGYGNNPYNQDQNQQDGTEGQDGEQQGEKQDSTKKRQKRALESYYFNDSIRALPNFRWNISRDFNKVQLLPLDTLLRDWRIDYPHYRQGVGNMSVGGLGQASQPVNWFERSTSRDFTFSSQYDAYTYNMENVSFYNLKRPYINLTYLESGQKRYREENFGITVSQNVSPSTNVSLEYKARGARGKYDRSRIKNHNFAGTFAHTGKRYSVHGAYFNNHIEQQENGGVVGEWAIRDTTFEMPSGVPMKLASAEAENVYRNNGFFLKQAYGIPLQRMTERDFSMAELSAVYIGHTFEYNSWSKIYQDQYSTYTNERAGRDGNGGYTSATDTYYKNWYLNPAGTRDSTYERVITNRLFVEAQPWDRNGVVGTLDGGIGLDMYTYSQFSLGDYQTGTQQKVRRDSWFAYGSVDGKIKKYVDWGADVKYYPSGYRGGDFTISGRIALSAYIKGKPLILSGNFRQSSTSPSYWQENWYSNHYIWQNSYSKEKQTRFEVALRMPDYAFEVGVWESIVTDLIYYGAEATPVQNGSEVSLTSIYARKDFRIGGLHLEHRAQVQLSSDEEVVPVPLVAAFMSYYYEFWAKKDVLRVQIGLDGRYNTAYYAPSYNPALSVFYNQRDVKVGNYPYMDAFVSAKWKRMRILIKYQHLNKGLFGNNDYFAVAGYPLNPSMIKFGISWSFYD